MFLAKRPIIPSNSNYISKTKVIWIIIQEGTFSRYQILLFSVPYGTDWSKYVSYWMSLGTCSKPWPFMEVRPLEKKVIIFKNQSQFGIGLKYKRILVTKSFEKPEISCHAESQNDHFPPKVNTFNEDWRNSLLHCCNAFEDVGGERGYEWSWRESCPNGSY